VWQEQWSEPLLVNDKSDPDVDGVWGTRAGGVRAMGVRNGGATGSSGSAEVLPQYGSLTAERMPRIAVFGTALYLSLCVVCAAGLLAILAQ
jgi:hypothetical protein